MIEARIECITYRYHVDDLGLDLRKGEVRWISESDARNSNDLALAIRAGAISVRYVERCDVARSPEPKKRTPVAIQMSRPNKGGLGSPVERPQHPGPRTREEDDEVARRAEDAARKAVQEGLAELKELLVTSQGSATIPQDQLEAALRNVLPAGGVAVGPGKKKAAEEEIHFFPEGMVDKDAKTEIQVESTSTEADDLDAAAAALAVTTGKKTRRKKKDAQNTDTESGD